MTIILKTFYSRFLLISAIVVGGCATEDPGPVQQTERPFSVMDFDRLEMGDAFNIQVTQGKFFEVLARGDRRNIDDLKVTKVGSTLRIRYNVNRNRRHQTFITITMPVLRSANFSGATNSTIEGFDDHDGVDIQLSGASVCQMETSGGKTEVTLSGASYLTIRGAGEILQASVSGASVLRAFDFPVAYADVNISGASNSHITVSNQLDVIARGASVVIYRGNPSVSSDVSGWSSVKRD